VAMTGAAALVCATQASLAQNQVFKIGLIASYTGAFATWGPQFQNAIEAYQAFVPKDALKTYVASDGNRKKITPKVIAADLKTLRKIPKNYEAYEFHYGHDEDAGGPYGIRFDATWEKRVVSMILHNLSSLFGQTFATVGELNRFRKSLAGAAPA